MTKRTCFIHPPSTQTFPFSLAASPQEVQSPRSGQQPWAQSRDLSFIFLHQTNLSPYLRHDPPWRSSMAWLTPARPVCVCVMYGSRSISPLMTVWTSPGTSSRDFQPPKAVPFHSHQLEGAGGDLFTSRGHADHTTLAPAAVGHLEKRTIFLFWE